MSKQVYYSVLCRLFKFEQLGSKHITDIALARADQQRTKGAKTKLFSVDEN